MSSDAGQRLGQGLEHRFRVLITGSLTSLRRIGKGPETISAASRYAPRDCREELLLMPNRALWLQVCYDRWQGQKKLALPMLPF